MVTLYADVEDRRRLQETMRHDGVVMNLDVQFRRRDGSPVWVRINVRTVEQDGQTVYDGVLQDVSDLRRAEEAVRNNPLAIITGRLQLLERLATDEGTAQKIAPAVEAARRIAEIVSYMGRISRLEERPDMTRSPMLDIRRSGADTTPP
jgi:signal transduction histidine kinase